MMNTISLSSKLRMLKMKHAASVPADKQDREPMSHRIMDLNDQHIRIVEALAKTPLVREEKLNLFFGVPVHYLLPEGTASWNEFFDLVVCKDQDAAAAIKLINMKNLDPQALYQLQQRFEGAFPPGFAQVMLVGMGSYFDEWCIEEGIKPLIDQALDMNIRIKNAILPVPSNLLKKLADPSAKALIKKKSLYGGKGNGWVPTEYGYSLGLVPGVRIDQNNHIRRLIYCAKDAASGLQEAASWGTGKCPPVPEPSSLSQRIELAERGMTTHTGVMKDLVRQLAEMPLCDYFLGDPNGFRELQEAFPDAHTYQEAADCLEKSHAGHLVRIFAGPLIRRTDIPIVHKPLRSFFMGASLLAKSHYLIWSGEKLIGQAKNNSAGKWSYQQWIQWMDDCIRKEEAASNNGVPSETKKYYDIIYYLTVEPFSMAYQETAVKNV